MTKWKTDTLQVSSGIMTYQEAWRCIKMYQELSIRQMIIGLLLLNSATFFTVLWFLVLLLWSSWAIWNLILRSDKLKGWILQKILATAAWSLSVCCQQIMISNISNIFNISWHNIDILATCEQGRKLGYLSWLQRRQRWKTSWGWAVPSSVQAGVSFANLLGILLS